MFPSSTLKQAAFQAGDRIQTTEILESTER